MNTIIVSNDNCSGKHNVGGMPGAINEGLEASVVVVDTGDKGSLTW